MYNIYMDNFDNLFHIAYLNIKYTEILKHIEEKYKNDKDDELYIFLKNRIEDNQNIINHITDNLDKKVSYEIVNNTNKDI